MIDTKHLFDRTTCALLLSVGLLACGGSAETDLEAAFCAALGADPSETVPAAARPEDAPPAPFGDRSTAVTLVGDGADRAGYVTYTPDEAGTFAFGLSADVPFEVRDAAGNPLALDRTVKGSQMCAELAVRHTVQLEIATYTVAFGPADAASVRVTAEESDDDLAP